MKKRFKDVIELVEYADLIRIKKDLEKGGKTISELIESRIEHEQKNHETICGFCQNNIDFKSTKTFTLLFGPDDFKKKATFCAVDCLEGFLNQFKTLHKVETKEEKNDLQRNYQNT